jgi:hypothetical protein
MAVVTIPGNKDECKKYLASRVMEYGIEVDVDIVARLAEFVFQSRSWRS